MPTGFTSADRFKPVFFLASLCLQRDLLGAELVSKIENVVSLSKENNNGKKMSFFFLILFPDRKKFKQIFSRIHISSGLWSRFESIEIVFDTKTPADHQRRGAVPKSVKRSIGPEDQATAVRLVRGGEFSRRSFCYQLISSLQIFIAIRKFEYDRF